MAEAGCCGSAAICVVTIVEPDATLVIETREAEMLMDEATSPAYDVCQAVVSAVASTT